MIGTEMSGAPSPVRSPGGQLLARERERVAFDRLPEAARGGHGGVLVVHGEPGVGARPRCSSMQARPGASFGSSRQSVSRGRWSCRQHHCARDVGGEALHRLAARQVQVARDAGTPVHLQFAPSFLARSQPGGSGFHKASTPVPRLTRACSRPSSSPLSDPDGEGTPLFEVTQEKPRGKRGLSVCAGTKRASAATLGFDRAEATCGGKGVASRADLRPTSRRETDDRR
jgi:hypothetical protein